MEEPLLPEPTPTPIPEEPMEIHAPEKPIHSLKDFFLHLLTITIGILIAMSLEGWMETRKHHKLVDVATANITKEITENKVALDGSLKNVDKQRKALENAFRFASDLLKTKKTDIHNIELGFAMPVPSSAAWKTAETTGALGHMGYPVVKKYAELYHLQDTYSRNVQQKLDRLSDAMSLLLAGEDPTKADAKDLEAFRTAVMKMMSTLQLEKDLGTTLSKAYQEALEPSASTAH